MDASFEDGELRFFLTSASGISVMISTHGAALVGLVAPDRLGRFEDVVLGYDSRSDYVANADMYFGCTVGRVAGRISGARFTLDGTEYVLAANNGRNHLHGGNIRSFDKVLWSAVGRTTSDGDEVELRHVSPHLEEGYPGVVEARVTYRLTADGELQVSYEATTDRPTPLSLTNHTYWNLAGAGAPTILDHELTIHADRYTPTDAELIPTGYVLPVDGTSLDFRSATLIGDRIDSLTLTGGLDHNFVLAAQGSTGGLAARACHPGSGRVLEIWTDQPCLQAYSGNLMRPTIGKMGRAYARQSGFCLEPQSYPDAVNHPAFDSVVVHPGTTYRAYAAYRLLVDHRAGRKILSESGMKE